MHSSSPISSAVYPAFVPSRRHDAYVDIVHDALARQLGVVSEVIRPAHRLRRDLGLDELDLADVALRFGRIAERPFPLSKLDRTQTVADLTDVVREWAQSGYRWWRVGDRASSFADCRAPDRSGSRKRRASGRG